MSSNPLVKTFSRVFNDQSHDLRGKIIGIYILLIAFNILAWLLAFLGFAAQYPTLLGVALVAGVGVGVGLARQSVIEERLHDTSRERSERDRWQMPSAALLQPMALSRGRMAVARAGWPP